MIRIDQAKFIEALNAVAATDDGQIVLAVLAENCGWDRTYLASEDAQVTQYYAARRAVYNGLRQHIRRQYLKKIEFDFKILNKMEKQDGTGTTAAKPAKRTIGKQ